MTKSLAGQRRRGSTRVIGAPAVDRYLCAFAHRSPRFAQYVLRVTTRPGLRALLPACGIDVVALVRHAHLAAGRWRRTRIIGASVFAGAVVLALAALFAGEAVLSVVLLLAAVAAVFGVVFADEYSRLQIRGSLASPGADVRTMAHPVAPALEDALEKIMDANVVVFTGGNPFVGGGKPVPGGWRISIDAARPGTDPQGNNRTVTPFEPTDLHKAMTLAVRGANIPNLEVHNRLFVAGASADSIPGLVPDPMNRPSSSVGKNEIRDGIEHPRPDARTYLCIDMTSWGGELVVTLYVRAAQIRTNLFIECHASVLLPLRAELTDIDHAPTGLAEMVWAAVVAAVRNTVPALQGSVGELLRAARADREYDRQRKKDMRDVRRNRPLDRGAGASLREVAAAEDRFFVFAYTDEEMHLDALQRRVLDAIHDFLDKHGVDTADFRQKQTNIVNNHTYTIGSIQSQLAQVGSNNTQTVNPTTGPGPGSPGGANPTPPPPWAGP
jgi:hypothetical protein